MVSLQAALMSSSGGMKSNSKTDTGSTRSKKRKFKDDDEEGNGEFRKAAKISTEKLDEFVELQMDTPLPLEWQRCLDIKSGKIHFYNTRTQMRSSEDPRPNLVSLDLDLNLSVEPNRSCCNAKDVSLLRGNSSGLSQSLAWMPFDAGDEQEMVAAVCMRCHMLVMMCKVTPSCPNCKFVHPPSDRKSQLVKPEFKILCCKD